MAVTRMPYMANLSGKVQTTSTPQVNSVGPGLYRGQPTAPTTPPGSGLYRRSTNSVTTQPVNPPTGTPPPTPTAPTPPTTGANPNAQMNQNGNPINPYDANHTMPQIDGVPIGAYGAQWQGSMSFDPSSNPRAQQWLDWMKQSDPSAHFQQEEVGGQNQWTFMQDHPGAEGVYPQLQEALRPYGGGQGLNNVYENADWQSTGASPHGFQGELIDDNRRINTPFGQITPQANVRQQRDLAGMMGPALIAAIATFASGGAASPMLISLLSRSPGMLESISNGSFNPMSLIGMVPGALGAVPTPGG